MVPFLTIYFIFLGPCGATQQDKHITVTVVVILASEEGSTVDKRLQNIAGEIQKLNPTLKSFQVKSIAERSVAPMEKVTIDLVDDTKAVIAIMNAVDEQDKVALAVTPPNQGEIVYSTVCGKFLPIVTRYQTKDRQRLILAIQVQPCKKK